MDFAILALTDRFDPSGLFCLATILWVVILIIAYCFGHIAGSFLCFIFFIIALCGTMDSRSQGGGGSIMVTEHMIANASQTKFIKQFEYSIDNPDCIFHTPQSRGWGKHNLFIPAEEMMLIEGIWRMKPDGRPIHSYSFARPEILKNRDWSNPNGWVYDDWGNSDSYLYKDKDGKIVKVNTGRPPTDDDFYLTDIIIDRAHAPKEAGGWGWPQWVYHPASAVLVFGIGALPIIVGSGILIGRMVGAG